MRLSIPTFLSLLLLSTAAHAHPHDDVEQQVLISVGADTVAVEVRIVPSFDEGADIFVHIDLNGDGAVSESEAIAFGEHVLSDAKLEVDGTEIALGNLSVTVPSSESVSAGLAIIKIDADASFEPRADTKLTVVFEIAYEEFSHDWFIQPFFDANLAKAMPTQSVQRSRPGHRVEILLSTDGEQANRGNASQ